MNPKIKQRWIEALRSGKFKQTKGRLFGRWANQHTKGEGHCCLGVLCEVAGLEHGEKIDSYVFPKGPGQLGQEIQEGSLAPSFRKHVGLPLELQCDLISMNDSGRTFEEIADRIEAEA